MECFSSSESFEGCGWLRPSGRWGGVVVDLREMRANLLCPTASVGLSGLDFLLGIWQDCWHSLAMRGSGIKFDRSIIVWRLGTGKGT